MNCREKFQSVANFDKVSEIPEWEFGYWYDAIQRWYKEGLPKINPPSKRDYSQWINGEADPALDVFEDKPNYYGNDVGRFFGFDERCHSASIYTAPLPKYEQVVFEEDKENIVFLREEDGKVVKTRKDGTSMPQFLEFPVKSKKDFEKIKERFNPEDKNRLPENFDELMKEYRKRTYVLEIGGTLFSGFFSILRELMGLEKTLFCFYDNPSMILEILDFFTDYYIKLYSKVVSKIEVDFVYIWEDMSYKNGPLISPELFKKFILPYYQKFTSRLKEFGVKNFVVDTDGNFDVLIDLFIEGGVTGLLPFEVQASMDIEKIRQKYPRLVILGGINKMALSKGKDEIMQEIEKVSRMIKNGGYIPYTDHAVPPDVSFDNYTFFRYELKKVLDNKM